MVVMSDGELFEKLSVIVAQGWIPIPDKPGYKGTGGPGLLLEELCGVSGKNRDGPDSGVWELKYHGGNAPLTLFHLTPEPKGNMHLVVRGYGWPDAQGRTSFRHTIWGESPRGFKVFNEENRVVVRNIGANAQSDIIAPYWSHNNLINSFAYKLRRLIVVQGKKLKGSVRYESAQLHWEPNTTRLFEAITNGIIAIDFDARTNHVGDGLRDHGTKFRIKIKDLEYLYAKSRKLGV